MSEFLLKCRKIVFVFVVVVMVVLFVGMFVVIVQDINCGEIEIIVCEYFLQNLEIIVEVLMEFDCWE